MNIGQKYKIRRSTQWFDSIWDDSYFRTVVFLDEYWFGVKSKTYKLFTYKKVPMRSSDWRYKDFYEIRYYPLPDSPTIKAVERYNTGIVVGHRKSTMYAVREYDILDNHAYVEAKKKLKNNLTITL